MIKEEKGFSLIEVIAAVTIMTVGILTVVSLINTNLKTSRESRNRLIALNLSQEGLELTRNYRDSLWKQGTRMQDTLIFKSDGRYVIDPKDGRLNSGKPSSLYLDPNTKLIHHNLSGLANQTLLPFSREIIISNVGAGNVTVTSLVEWENKEIKLVETLYDWKP
jgi:prepilin-type N-terminal cleavage/methylation domain-containing protein